MYCATIFSSRDEFCISDFSNLLNRVMSISLISLGNRANLNSFVIVPVSLKKNWNGNTEMKSTKNHPCVM